MTPEHVATARKSFVRLASRYTQVADMFRVNLLRIDPTLTTVFDNDPEGHGLMQTFAAVVALLHKPDLLLPALQRMGRRLGPDVDAEQIAAVGRAVMDTLRQALGRRWDAETEGAWTAVYAMVSMTVVSALLVEAQAFEPLAA